MTKSNTRETVRLSLSSAEIITFEIDRRQTRSNLSSRSTSRSNSTGAAEWQRPACSATHKVPLFDIARDKSKHGAPYPRYFEDVIAIAMLVTGATGADQLDHP